MAGCDVSNAFYCFPCLLFQSKGSEQWTERGVQDLKHLSEKCTKHEYSHSHLDSSVKLALLGKHSLTKQLEKAHRISSRKHNKEVTKKRHTLSRMIDCVASCRDFKVAVQRSGQPRLVDLASTLEGEWKDHLKNTTGLADVPDPVLPNELLHCMWAVLKEHIVSEARSSEFLSIQLDEITGSATEPQLSVVLRYVDNENATQERFYEFIPLQSATKESIATMLKDCLAGILPEDQRSKLICQAYDGASRTNGVQKLIKDVYPNAHSVHCYSHQLREVVKQATSHLSGVRVFFADLSGFTSFFTASPRRMAVLDKLAGHIQS